MRARGSARRDGPGRHVPGDGGGLRGGRTGVPAPGLTGALLWKAGHGHDAAAAYTEQEIVRHVEARMERSAVLTRKTPARVGYVIEEAILERPLGSETVLKEQLLHLLECMRTMNHLTLQVMPARRHTHAGHRQRSRSPRVR
ncbi:Scr1 family TA system antitoxin-like transcriptional regulator [Streptomyces sp. NPDC059258]|uniref:Scr1 family TA system antitoxin-like transcriptional regulator n=1 Tax=unclassified Streptomyces TaxID=2593676 RepID=UPI003694A8B2